MDGTLMRKAMHADPENYVSSMAPGQYWTWGTHMRGMKGKRDQTQCTRSKTTHIKSYIYASPNISRPVLYNTEDLHAFM